MVKLTNNLNKGMQRQCEEIHNVNKNYIKTRKINNS